MKRKQPPKKQKKRWQELKSNKGRFSWISISVAFLFLIVSCGGESPPLPVPEKSKAPAVATKKPVPVKVAEKKEPEKKEEPAEYSYNPVGKPDPFKPFIQLTGKEFPRTVPLTPLQKYDVSQLKLVAIITAPEGNIALVEDSLGKGYFLKKGTWIGKNNGKVIKILKDRVMIEEVYEDVFGQKKVNEISLMLHRIEEGGES